MHYQRLSKFTLKLILSLSLIFQFKKTQSMEIPAIAAAGAATTATPIILPAIAIAVAYKLLQDKSNPLGESFEYLNEKLLQGIYSENLVIKPKTAVFFDKSVQTKLELLFNDFTKKQQEILDTTHNKKTECINIGNLKINDYTSTTKAILNSDLEIEQSPCQIQEQIDKSEKAKDQDIIFSNNHDKLRSDSKTSIFSIMKSMMVA